MTHLPTNRKATPAMMHAKAAKWRQCSASPSTATMNTPNTVSAIASCAILSWPGVHPARKPTRFAGTAKQYSTPATSQEMRITVSNGFSSPPLPRCQYQATVMNTFDAISSRIVAMKTPFVPLCALAAGGAR